MFDGDALSLICSLTEESRNEIREYKMDKRAYIGPDGTIRYSLNYDTIAFVCHNLCVFEEEVK